MAKERRTRIQLYFDIISAIFEEEMDNDSISPTRIQFKCNTSYDKLTKYLEEMKNKEIKILLAAPRGFCAGVDRAIDIVEKALDKYGAEGSGKNLPFSSLKPDS